MKILPDILDMVCQKKKIVSKYQYWYQKATFIILAKIHNTNRNPARGRNPYFVISPLTL